MNCTVYSGIHTLSFSKPLTGEVYYRILHKAQKKGMQIETDTTISILQPHKRCWAIRSMVL